MMSSETFVLTTHTQSYDKPKDKKNENLSLDKDPPTGPPSAESLADSVMSADKLAHSD